MQHLVGWGHAKGQAAIAAISGAEGSASINTGFYFCDRSTIDDGETHAVHCDRPCKQTRPLMSSGFANAQNWKDEEQMKLLRYGARGQEKPGCLDAQGRVRDLSAHVADIAGAALLPDEIARLRALEIDSLPIVDGTPQDDLRLGPCVGQVGKFICIGLNYADHAAESGLAVPPEPVIFGKWTSAIIGPDDDIMIPPGSVKTDWEVELGVVIGQGGVHIDEADAMAHVAGFCVINDVSEREYQMERAGTWDKGKGCDTFGPTGPWLVTPDEVADHDNLRLWLDVDGKRYQDGTTATMVYKVPHLIAYCSRFMSLQPGDIISTGTPPGVGMGQKPQRYLAGGETVRLGIDGLGVQTQKVVSQG